MQMNYKLAALSVILAPLTSVSVQAEESWVSGGIGAGVAYGPTFPGSDESETEVFPVIDLKIGRFGFLNQRGLGVQNNQSIGSGDLRYGFGLGYDFTSRSAEDDQRLIGLPEVKAGALATLFLEYETRVFTYAFELQHGLSDEGHEGTRATFSASYDMQLSDRVGLSLTPYVSWANDEWMEAFFSVSQPQSLATGLAAYDAEAGFSEAGLKLTASYALKPRAILFASLDYMTLLGDAKDSSLSFDNTAASLTTGVMFRF